MRYYFIVEDNFGPDFIKNFFSKKLDEGLFSGVMYGAKHVPIGPKMARVIKTVVNYVDRIIILADAEGDSLENKEEKIMEHIDKCNLTSVRIVLLDYEIEDWICYSLGINTNNMKPSSFLRHDEKYHYKKNQLPKYVGQMDCAKLKTCESFQRLLSALCTREK